jgi:hypothetical protein
MWERGIGWPPNATRAIVKRGIRNLVLGAAGLAAAALMGRHSLKAPAFAEPKEFSPSAYAEAGFRRTVERVEAAFAADWAAAGLEPVGRAEDLIVARRLSLALTGSVPSLEEIRAFEAYPGPERVQWWLSHLFTDRRYSDYFAERFARTLVGVEAGPFILFRRHRLVSWLSDQFHANRPYDALVRELVTAQGVWTSKPAANFITATVDPNNEAEGPDQVKLAGRVSKAFLAVRLDCVECHDDFLGGPWKQQDFHQLAAFFAPAKMSLTGVRDDPTNTHRVRYLGQHEPAPIPTKVPFKEELLPPDGALRTRLAAWITHPENRAFARALVNRVWALVFNRPLVQPVDSLSLEGPWPPALEVLADDLVAHRFDLQRLIRVIAATSVFQRDSRSDDPAHPVGESQSARFAAFPLTRLRPEQVAGSILQSASLQTLDASSHVVVRIARLLQQRDFVRRYGDLGEDEFAGTAGTLPQRLLLMNGRLVHERTQEDIVMNAATRIAVVAPDHPSALEAAYLATLARRPTLEEQRHFLGQWQAVPPSQRARCVEDLYWTLINSTAFSWNH